MLLRLLLDQIRGNEAIQFAWDETLAMRLAASQLKTSIPR